MKFFQRDSWYRKSMHRSIQILFPKRKMSSLRSRLLAVTGVGALLMSGLTFAIGGVGAIAWPVTVPAGEATGGVIMSYFKNAFGDASTQTQKTCTNSGVIR